MQRKLISQLTTPDEVVRLCGWVETVRNQRRMQFLILRDHTGLVQIINERTANPDVANKIDTLTPESAVEITGKVMFNKAVKLGGKEIVVQSLNIVGYARSPLPLQEHASQENRLDWRFLDLRKPKNQLIFELQTVAEHAMRSFWTEHGFLEIHSPKLMGSASESGAELFRVEYFDRHAYLAQSPQFYKQMAMAAGFDRVFEIGPVFRANPSFTTRHDTEFTSIDVEISWVDSHEDVMAWEEKWLHSVLSEVKNKLGDKIEEMYGAEIRVPEIPFPRITMAEAYDILGSKGHQVDRGLKGDLDPEGERILSRYFQETRDHEFVFVTEYPAPARAFYHMRPAANPKVTKSFDLLWKGLELTTGAQREHRYDQLVDQAKEKGIDPESIKYYLDFFRYGCPPHGGYGFGLTRMLMLMLNLKNVREVTYLYRGVNRLTP